MEYFLTKTTLDAIIFSNPTAMHDTKTSNFLFSLTTNLFLLVEWFDDGLRIGNPFIYRSAKIYVPQYPLLPHSAGASRLESEEINLRQDVATKQWQLKTVSVITGYPEWRNLSLLQESIVINAFEKDETPVLKITHEA